MESIILNLTEQISPIKYRVDSFPDGQHNVVILNQEIFFNKKVLIFSRLSNWVDLEILSCAVASLRECGVDEISLFAPFIIGSRSDRKFEEGGNNYLKNVICPAINNLKFKQVMTMDPHSYCLEMGIDNFSNNHSLQKTFYQWAIQNVGEEYFDVLQPDHGAKQRTMNFCNSIGYLKDVIVANKTRKYSEIDVEFSCDLTSLSNDIVICDDICDGGGTFIALALKLREKGYKGNLHLIVTHGIFSRTLDFLFEHYKTISCTNSYHPCGVANDFKKRFFYFDVFK